MKKFIAIVLVVVLALTFLMPAVGVSAKSPHIEVSGTFTTTNNDPSNVVKKDTGNGFIQSGVTRDRNYEGGIDGTFFMYNNVMVKNYGEDGLRNTDDDFRHFRFEGIAGVITIADTPCVDVEISLRVKSDDGLIGYEYKITGIGTIGGETADGRKVHGVLYIWSSGGGTGSYSGEVHFTP